MRAINHRSNNKVAFEAKIHGFEIKGAPMNQSQLVTKPLSESDEALAEKARVEALERVRMRRLRG